MELITFNIDWILVLTFIVSALLPLVVGLVTNKVTSPVRKGVLLAVLAFITSILSEILAALVAGEAYDVGAGLAKWLAILVTAIASYFGILSRPKSDGESIAAAVAKKGVK